MSLKPKFTRKIERKLGESVDFGKPGGALYIGGKKMNIPHRDHPIWDKPARNIEELANLLKKIKRRQ